MGINIPTREELIANKLNSKELAKYVGKFYCDTVVGKSINTFFCAFRC